jgi:cyclic dehypoxanthinyl futalosine synthase
MQLNDLYQKALNLEFLSVEEGMFLFEHAPLTELVVVADTLR